jgi:hypothetical protein
MLQTEGLLAPSSQEFHLHYVKTPSDPQNFYFKITLRVPKHWGFDFLSEAAHISIESFHDIAHVLVSS